VIWALSGWALALAWVDLRQRRLPNLGLLAGFLIWLVSIPLFNLHWLSALAQWSWWGMLAGFALWLPSYLWFGGGAGDVKLAALLGGIMGEHWLYWLLLSALMVGGISQALRWYPVSDTVPAGAVLLFAALLCWHGAAWL
jgi:prepilin peptidase CpaA